VKSSKESKKHKHDDSDDLDEMREAFKNHQNRAKGGGGSGNTFAKLEKGKNLCYFLPIPGQRKFYAEGWTHFQVGPNERAVRCVDEAHIDAERGLPQSGTKCPRCKRFLREQARINSEYEKGDEDGRAEWKAAKDKYVPRHQYYSNVLREDDDGDFEVKILPYGPQVWGQLMNFYIGSDTDVGDFTDPKSGKWLNIKKVDKGGRNRRNVEYQVFPVDGPSISSTWATIKDALHDLDAARGKVLSLEEFVAVEKGVDVDKDSDDDDDGKHRRKRSRAEDDEDEDAESDDGDDEEEEEEDAVRTERSKLAVKMKKRRRDD